MKKAVIYSRFSPRPTAEECKSIEKQVAHCKAIILKSSVHLKRS
ncbi:MAG: hypothetical protein ACYTEE_09355 [Planctomycetota bacterium]